MHNRCYRLSLVLGSLLCLTLGACGGAPGQPLIDVQQAMLGTEGVLIEAEDGSFSLHTNATVATPFASYDCPLRPSTANFEAAEQWGARRVRVHVPFVSEPLYGLLSFCPVPADATGPATRLSLVQVPEAYVNATEGGRVSVVYEPLEHEYRAPRTYHPITQWPAWVLYLSRQPFPAVGSGAIDEPAVRHPVGGQTE